MSAGGLLLSFAVLVSLGVLGRLLLFFAGDEWRLAETPLESEDRVRRDAPSR